jgi:tRNA-2-methylthio-N6-dimethylallyladenosine synthase
VREVGFAGAYTFKYSARPGTPASGLGGQVPEAVMSARLETLQHLIVARQSAFNAATVGRTVPVLLDRRGKRAGQLIGRSPWMQSVVVAAADRLMGTIVEVRIETSGPNSLAGEVVTVDRTGVPRPAAVGVPA